MEMLLISFYLYKLSASTDPVGENISRKRSVEKADSMSRLTSSVVPLQLQSTTNKHSIGSKDGHDDKTTISMIKKKFKRNETSLDKTKSEFGYVMATGYYDQITGSSINLVSMHCWVRTLGPKMRVVEPFIRRSILGVNLCAASDNCTAPDGEDNSVRFGDVLDKEHWEKDIISRNQAPFISWDYFIKNAPRKLILVEKDIGCGRCMDCEVSSKNFLKHSKTFAKKHNFKIIKTVCYPRSQIPDSKFKSLIYGNHDPLNVVVIFKTWSGIGGGRVPISGASKCGRGPLPSKMPVSSAIIQDGAKYVKKYLPNAYDRGYISVMLRLEHYANSHERFIGKSKTEIISTVMKCYNTLLTEVKAIKAKYKLNSVFLTMDCRKRGSDYFSEFQTDQMWLTLRDSAPTFYRMLYGNTSTIEEWDSSFEDISSFSSHGYIALLQKHLAASGRCLLTVGGGSFQSTTHSLYTSYHAQGFRCNNHLSTC